MRSKGMIKLKYISQLTNEQIKEIMEIYAPSHTDLSYKLSARYLEIYLRDREGCEDNYRIYDFDIDIVDWIGNEHLYLKKYREKMLSWFGNQYAVDYLLE